MLWVRPVDGRKRSSRAGFTLIELLVVIAIIGILAAVAISQYSLYKQRASDAGMLSVMHNAMQATEALYAGSQPLSYSTATLATLGNFGYKPSIGVDLMVVVADDFGYILRVCSIGGTTPAYLYDSAVGSINPDGGSCS